MPKFSIIIPVYNVAPYLRECLDSVVAQTFADWEAICVDDGSPDGSGAILDEYAGRDKRFRVIHQPNAGVSAARNAALDVARGEWICFVDADDKVEANWLFDIDAAAVAHPGVDWIRTSYRDWPDGEEARPWPQNSVHRYEMRFYTEDIRNIAWREIGYAGMPFLNAYRKDVVGDLRFDTSLRLAEDTCFISDMLGKVRTLMTIPNDSYCYRLRAGSACHSKFSCLDMAYAMGQVYKRWMIHPDSEGGYTPSLRRHAWRFWYPGCFIHDNDADKFRRVAIDAWKSGMFKFRKLPCGLFERIRWAIFMIGGNIKVLFVGKRDFLGLLFAGSSYRKG